MKRIEEVIIMLLMGGKNVFLTEEGRELIAAAFPEGQEKGEEASA